MAAWRCSVGRGRCCGLATCVACAEAARILAPLLKLALATLLMVAAVHGCNVLTAGSLNPWIELVLLVLVGALSYFAAQMLLFRSLAMDAVDMFRHKGPTAAPGTGT